MILLKIVYHSETFDYKEAAKRENANVPRGKFIMKYDIPVYPDTLVWVRDFAYSYNEPMAKQYYSHPAFGNYPVVGINWKQATAFCEWRTHYLNAYLTNKNRATESPFRASNRSRMGICCKRRQVTITLSMGRPLFKKQERMSSG